MIRHWSPLRGRGRRSGLCTELSKAGWWCEEGTTRSRKAPPRFALDRAGTTHASTASTWHHDEAVMPATARKPSTATSGTEPSRRRCFAACVSIAIAIPGCSCDCPPTTYTYTLSAEQLGRVLDGASTPTQNGCALVCHELKRSIDLGLPDGGYPDAAVFMHEYGEAMSCSLHGMELTCTELTACAR